MELGYHLLGTQGNTDLRTSIFKSILNKGIKLTNYSPPTTETKKYLEQMENDGMDGINYPDQVLLQITNKIAAAVDTDTDLLVVECGPTNVTYMMSYAKGQQMSSVAYANQIISNYKGIVFYVHTDPALPLTFFPEYYTIAFTNEYLKYGGFYNLQHQKTWAVLTPALNTELVADYYIGARDNYKELENAGLITIEHLEPHYGCLYDWGTFQTVWKPKYDLSYVGAERNRLAKFEKFMAKPGKQIKANLWGRWTDPTIAKYPSVTYHGQLGKGLSREVYNDSVATIIIADIMCEKLGWITGRFFETITAQSVPLVDIDLARTTNLKNILSPELLGAITIRNHADVILKVKKLKNDPAYRAQLIQDITQECMKFSADDTVARLKQLWLKYKVKHVKRGMNTYNVEQRLRVVTVFQDLQRKRMADPTEYNKLLWEMVTGIFYKKNVPARQPPYLLTPGAEVQPVSLPEGLRCYKCGTLNANAPRTRFLCDDCKADPTGRVSIMEGNFHDIKKKLNQLNK
jgi:hypothetical protein